MTTREEIRLTAGGCWMKFYGVGICAVAPDVAHGAVQLGVYDCRRTSTSVMSCLLRLISSRRRSRFSCSALSLPSSLRTTSASILARSKTLRTPFTSKESIESFAGLFEILCQDFACAYVSHIWRGIPLKQLEVILRTKDKKAPPRGPEGHPGGAGRTSRVLR